MEHMSWRLERKEQGDQYLLCLVVDGERRSIMSFPTQEQREAAEKDFRQMMSECGSTDVKLQ